MAQVSTVGLTLTDRDELIVREPSDDTGGPIRGLLFAVPLGLMLWAGIGAAVLAITD